MNSQFQPRFEVICAAFSVICFVAILLFSSLAAGAGVSPIARLFESIGSRLDRSE